MSASLLHAAAVVAGVVLVGCLAQPAWRRADGVEASSLPEALRADYAVFAQRCSKCHSLARPLEAGVRGDAWWARYVTKMRNMPGSGISPEDEAPILRFLHAYNAAEPK